jgi:hypothetical protein
MMLSEKLGGGVLTPLVNLDVLCKAGACTLKLPLYLVWTVPFSGERNHL